jgi:hypothetical protein
LKQFESSGSSVYHALTLTLNKRFSRHYQLLGSYTWSHAIDDATDLATFEEPQDNQNARLDRGNSSSTNGIALFSVESSSPLGSLPATVLSRPFSVTGRSRHNEIASVGLTIF